jgi:hypothetical protein
VERIEPIRPDRSVQPVELPRLTPVEREQERQRRERERRRRAQARRQDPPRDGGAPGIDVRV